MIDILIDQILVSINAYRSLLSIESEIILLYLVDIFIRFIKLDFHTSFPYTNQNNITYNLRIPSHLQNKQERRESSCKESKNNIVIIMIMKIPFVGI